MKRSLEHHRRHSCFLYGTALWKDWLDHHIPTVIANHLEQLAEHGLHTYALRQSVIGPAHGPLDRNMEARLRRGTQRWFAKEIQSRIRYSAHSRMQQRIRRWGLPGLPHRTSARILRQLVKLRKLCQPRIVAAALSTIWNRWTTERRMTHGGGHHRGCLLGCSPTAADSIEHYFQCRFVREWRDKRLPPIVRSHGLQEALLATPMNDVQLKNQGLLTYVVYRTTNDLRHQTGLPHPPPRDFVVQYMNQMVHEGLRGGDTSLNLSRTQKKGVQKRKAHIEPPQSLSSFKGRC
jgi:hypothetical protein